MLVTALKDSLVYTAQRSYKTCLTSARLFVRHKKNGTVAINNRIPLQSLSGDNIMVEGSIIGYESNVKSGGVGARYSEDRYNTQYQLDQIAVNLRVVDLSTGRSSPR